jgi:hypothetical protein
MKRKSPGRPKKSAKSQHPWRARAAAIELRHALKLMRDFASKKWTDKHAEYEAIEQQKEAWSKFGLCVGAHCDHDQPWEFLRQIADELEGKLDYSSSYDSKIMQAYWIAYWAPGKKAFARIYAATGDPFSALSEMLRVTEGRCVTEPEWEEQFQKLWGNRPLPRRFILRRSLERLGYYITKL